MVRSSTTGNMTNEVCPGMAYFKDHEGAYDCEVTGFAMNPVCAGYETAVLLAVPDSWFWRELSVARETAWQFPPDALCTLGIRKMAAVIDQRPRAHQGSIA